ncbi:hypothetical protein DSECCO2_463010 [anaerobic digester metagenome]
MCLSGGHRDVVALPCVLAPGGPRAVPAVDQEPVVPRRELDPSPVMDPERGPVVPDLDRQSRAVPGKEVEKEERGADRDDDDDHEDRQEGEGHRGEAGLVIP